MMERSLGKDSRLIFCFVLHFKNLNLSIRIHKQIMLGDDTGGKAVMVTLPYIPN